MIKKWLKSHSLINSNKVYSIPNVSRLEKKKLLSIEDGPKFWVVVEDQTTRNQSQIIQIKTVNLIDKDKITFISDWLHSDEKYNISITEYDFLVLPLGSNGCPLGNIITKWTLFDCYIQEMHHEIVYDKTIGDITLRLNYNYALLT